MEKEKNKPAELVKDYNNIEERHIDNIQETDTHVIIHYKKPDEEVEEPLEDEPLDEDIAAHHDEEDKKINDDEMYRNIEKDSIERRNFNVSEMRVANKETREVVGYASVFNSLSENLGGFREKIDRDAFNDVMKDDVRALFNHDANYILGRTTAGTLRISVDDKGLKYRFNAPDTTYGNDLMVSLERGDVSQSSFGFIVEEDSWDKNENGGVIRTITKVSRLLDVSPVTYPAYPEASVGKRNLQAYHAEQDKKELEKQNKDLIKRNLLENKIKLLKIKNK